MSPQPFRYRVTVEPLQALCPECGGPRSYSRKFCSDACQRRRNNRFARKQPTHIAADRERKRQLRMICPTP